LVCVLHYSDTPTQSISSLPLGVRFGDVTDSQSNHLWGRSFVNNTLWMEETSDSVVRKSNGFGWWI